MLRTWLIAASALMTICLLLTAVSRQTNYGYHRLYKSMTTRRDDHSELVEVLTELLGLLDLLAAIEPKSLLYPQPDTGKHAPGTINATAASVAGYSAQAITLMSSLPYIQDYEFQIGHSTHMVDYAYSTEDGFMEQRIVYGEDGEEFMHPSAVQVTSGESIYGLRRIYDVDQKIVHVWDMNEHDEYFEAPPLSPREAFQPLINDFRSLKWLVSKPLWGLQTEWPWAEFPREWRESLREGYEADYKVWKAVRGLADIYISCGWQLDTVEQPAFRRDEFMERRKRHIETVVEPLEEIAHRTHDERRAKEAAEEELWLSRHGQSDNPAHGVL